MLRVVSANHELKFIKCTRAACKLEKLELSYHLQLHALSFCIPRVGQYNATYYIRLQKYFNKNFDMQQNFHIQTVRRQHPGFSPRRQHFLSYWFNFTQALFHTILQNHNMHTAFWTRLHAHIMHTGVYRPHPLP